MPARASCAILTVEPGVTEDLMSARLAAWLARQAEPDRWPVPSSERSAVLLTRHREPACAEQCLAAVDSDSS